MPGEVDRDEVLFDRLLEPEEEGLSNPLEGRVLVQQQLDAMRRVGPAPGIDQPVVEREGVVGGVAQVGDTRVCLLYTSPSPRDRTRSRMPSSA